jgi:hypothetical protein
MTERLRNVNRHEYHYKRQKVRLIMTLIDAINSSDLRGSKYAAVVVCDVNKDWNQKIMTARGRTSGWWRDSPKADVLVCLCHTGHGDRTVRAGRIKRRSGEAGDIVFHVDRFRTIAVVPGKGITKWCGKQPQQDTIGINLTVGEVHDSKGKIHKSLGSTISALRARIASADQQPRTIEQTVVRYSRNPDVVALALKKAKGQCEACHQVLPFVDELTSFPFLVVHHRKPLADGGLDNEENTVAICPNCHSHAHYRLRT